MNRDQWWLDYIEGELDPATEFEMRRVLRASYKDLELVSSLNAMKKLIRHHDEVLDPSPVEMKRMHNNIMEQIMNRDIEVSFTQKSAKKKRVHVAHLQLLR